MFNDMHMYINKVKTHEVGHAKLISMTLDIPDVA